MFAAHCMMWSGVGAHHSAAGVGLMGCTGGMYRFSDHLKWSWAVALGYFASILTSIYVNGRGH
jgi:hypothetical protein